MKADMTKLMMQIAAAGALLAHAAAGATTVRIHYDASAISVRSDKGPMT